MDTRSNRFSRDGLLYGERSIKEPLGHEAQSAGRVAAFSGGKSMKMFGRRVPLPRNRWLRMVIGGLLIVGGLLGFLPILGLWMLPLGLVVLSIDFPWVRRWRRRSEVWGTRRYRKWKLRR